VKLWIFGLKKRNKRRREEENGREITSRIHSTAQSNKREEQEKRIGSPRA